MPRDTTRQNQNPASMDLMQPGEDWRNVPDSAERRKIQNRIAQRAYRRGMRARKIEIEQLKQQLQEVQGGAASADDSDTRPATTKRRTSAGQPRRPSDQHPTPSPSNHEDMIDHGPRLDTVNVPSNKPDCTANESLIPTPPGSMRGQAPTILHPTMPQLISTDESRHEALANTISSPHAHDIVHEHVDGSGADVFHSGMARPSFDGQPWDAWPWNTRSDTPFSVLKPGRSEPIAPMLHLSISSGNCDILRMLLRDDEVFIDEKDSSGLTPLQRAIIMGRSDMVAALLEHGAAVLVDHDG